MKTEPGVSHEDCVIAELRANPNLAKEYLKAALEDLAELNEPEVFLIALRRLAKANGGMAKVAKASGVGRESLYRALSKKGNPSFSTVAAVTKAVGGQLTIK